MLRFYSQYRYIELSKLFLIILLWDTLEKVHLLNCLLTYANYLFLLCFILNCRGILFLSLVSNSLFCGIYKHNFSQLSKKYIYFNFRSTTTSPETKFLLPKPSYHWETDHFRGSVECGEAYLDSDINLLVSGNLLHYTTVPSQCEWFPRTWT